MSEIILKNMSYYYEEYFHPVFEQVNLRLDTDWKTGLIGRNGRGKTTLLELLSGKLEPSKGEILMQVRCSYFPYESDRRYQKALDVVKENIGGLRTMEIVMDEIISENDETRMEEYCRIQERYQELDGYSMESAVYKEIERLHLDVNLLEQDFDTLSGGERTKLLILALFLRKDSFVLLDEPTNHLDVQGKKDLAEYLKKKSGFIMVSHDTKFLDQVIDHVLSINKTDITIEQGTYETWKNNVELKEQYEQRTKERLQKEIGQLERRAGQARDWSGVANKQKYEFRSMARSNGAQALMGQAKRAEQQVQKNLEEKKTLLRNLEQAQDLEIQQSELEDVNCLLKVKHLSFSFPDSDRRLFRNFRMKVNQGERIWLRGENGTGKSTLLKLLSGQLPGADVWMAEGLKIAAAFQEPLWTSGSVTQLFMKAIGVEDRKNAQYLRFLELCMCFDVPEDFVKRPLETLSSGELKKVDIARALSYDNQILFMDEPLNFMDGYFRGQLERALIDSGVTVLFVEHDRSFGAQVATRVIELVYEELL